MSLVNAGSLRTRVRNLAGSLAWRAFAVVPLLMLVVGVPLPAQQTAPEIETIASEDVSEDELELFTRCLEDILSIRQELEVQLGSIQEPAEAQRVQEEASEAMIVSLQDRGMEVERYNQIAQSLTEDQELTQRVESKRLELREEEESN